MSGGVGGGSREVSPYPDCNIEAEQPNSKLLVSSLVKREKGYEQDHSISNHPDAHSGGMYI